MSSARTHRLSRHLVLAGDGALLMAAACAVLAPLAVLYEAATFPLMAVGLLAPLLVWWLHGRKVDRTATLGAVIGYPAGVGVALGLVLLTVIVMLLITAVGLAANADDAGRVLGQIQAVVIAVAFLALAAWLDVDALRDIAAKRRAHVSLDVARLLATVAGVAYLAGVVVWATGHPEFDYIGALLSLGGCGVVGAAVVTVADLMAGRHEQQSRGRLDLRGLTGTGGGFATGDESSTTVVGSRAPRGVRRPRKMPPPDHPIDPAGAMPSAARAA